VGGGFQIVERCLGLERRDIRRRQIEGGEFSHLVARGIVYTADQYANMAHAELLGSGDGHMLP
jgi:hypothetical protein